MPILLDGRELEAGMLAFIGTEKALCRPWPPEPGEKGEKTEAAVKAKRKAVKAPVRARTAKKPAGRVRNQKKG
jgi:hypothetical protein